MKKYLVFKGAVYYPGFAWEDFIGDFDTLEEAVKSIGETEDYSWSQIVDTETKTVVDEKTYGFI